MPEAAALPQCRFCKAELSQTFVDLGLSPPCESFVHPDKADQGEMYYPLHARVCRECFLVQLDDQVAADDIFMGDYAYYSSFSDSWLKHAARFCEVATERLSLSASSFVVEVASNDGYLLRNFVDAGVPCLGIEPSANVAEAAEKVGVQSKVVFFGEQTAKDLVAERGHADLIVGNNVLAHVPDINDFVAGLATLVAETGAISLEFPHLERLMAEVQYDTIYHEHFSYLSFRTVQRIFEANGLEAFDVEHLPSHGGSLRVWGQRKGGQRPISDQVTSLADHELTAGFEDPQHYADFTRAVERSKRELLKFLIQAKERGETVVAYGAPGKGNTLLNYCGIRTDLIAFAVDRNPHKHGRFTPGTRIPIHPPEALDEARPDWILILPWNLSKEITAQLAHAREWGARFVVPIPGAREIEPEGALSR